MEGKNSEPDYFRGLKQLPHIRESTAVSVALHPEHGVPLTLVEMAIERSADPEIDSCWCVFDVEWPVNHPNLQQAVSLAQRHGIGTAISNPCFELWLLLHYQDCGKFLHTRHAETLSMRADGRSGKSVDPDLYLQNRAVAAQRAEALDRRHAQNGCALPHDNPSSGMYRLLRALGDPV